MFDFITFFVRFVIDLVVAWAPYAAVISALYVLWIATLSPRARNFWGDVFGVEDDVNYKYTP